MSQENVELVKRCFKAWNARDLDAWVVLFHPDCELLLPRNILEGGSYRGHEGVRRASVDAFATWEDLRIEVEDIRVIDDRALALCRATAVGKSDAPTVDYESAYLLKIRDGKIAYLCPYQSRRDALKAVGLSE